MSFDALAYWHWLVIGLVLLTAEMLLSTEFVLLAMGAAALLTGAAAWLLPTHWTLELVLFGGLSVGSYFIYRRFRREEPLTDQPLLNRRGQSYIGRTFTLGEPIVNGIGKLRVDDSQWRISGNDAPAGTRVRVVRADGATLHVEALP